MTNATTVPVLKVVFAFGAVYVIWGSTYFAIAFAIETLPPMLMAGARFLVAGLLLFLWVLFKRHQWPSFKQWKSSFISGSLLLIGGNVSVVFAEKYIPSAIAAITIASVPIWLVTLDGQQRKNLINAPFLLIGLIVGFLGVLYLIGFDPDILNGFQDEKLLGFGLLILATISWAIGSLYSRHQDHPTNSVMKSSLQMITAGTVTLIAGFLRGEAAHFTPEATSWESIAAFFYLIIFGTIIGYSSYIWLLKIRPPAQVGTYAYVNPVIAVLLGWSLRDEPVTSQTITAMVIILAGVFLINYAFIIMKKKARIVEAGPSPITQTR
ncbi:MAG: EamA family transporter [Cyclobacteriaceae bacterium]|nr:EamA family transporter [Cyclobacteriaceae bacterium]